MKVESKKKWKVKSRKWKAEKTAHGWRLAASGERFGVQSSEFRVKCLGFRVQFPAFIYPLSRFPQGGKASSIGCCCSICYIKYCNPYFFPILAEFSCSFNLGEIPIAPDSYRDGTGGKGGE